MCARKIRIIELSGAEEIVQKPSKPTPKPKEQEMQVITTSEATKTQESIMETTHQPIATQPVEQKRRRGRPRKNETIQSTSSLPLRRRLSGRKPAPKMGLNAETIQVVTEFIGSWRRGDPCL